MSDSFQFTTDQLKIIYKAVRKFQMNDVALNGKAYQDCADILDIIFPLAVNSKE